MDRQLYLAEIDRVNREGKYHPDWDSLAKHPVPAWYREERLGIFLHWGVFSVPAYHDWYARNMYIQGSEEYEHHLRCWGSHKTFGYQNFIPMLTMENFQPGEWVELFRAAGADYIVPVAEHHDGFQMYKSELSHFNAAEMGPKRDVLGELKAEFEKRGMIFATSSHRAEHLWFMGHGKDFDSDIKEPLQVGDFYWPSLQEQPEDNFETVDEVTKENNTNNFDTFEADISLEDTTEEETFDKVDSILDEGQFASDIDILTNEDSECNWDEKIEEKSRKRFLRLQKSNLILSAKQNYSF